MDRSEFIKQGLSLMVVAIPLIGLASSCTTNVEPAPIAPTGSSPKDCLANGTTSSIGSNHGHSITVSKADVDAAVDKTYAIQGTSGHGHSVTITASNFASLKNNQSIQVASTEDSGHTHSIAVGCA